MKAASACLLCALLCLFGRSTALCATELTDLGDGLGYLRVHELDEAVKPLAGTGALVLDLRHAIAAPGGTAAFANALAGRTTAGARLFVLVGPDTPTDVAGVLKGNLVTLGVKGSHPEPQVAVQQSTDDDRKAYDALTSGSTLTDLISGKVEKERYDEASLVQEFKGGNHDARPPEAVSTGNAKPVPPLTDRVLQRAVHLHRALLALKR